jgi:hypothetical protein
MADNAPLSHIFEKIYIYIMLYITYHLYLMPQCIMTLPVQEMSYFLQEFKHMS